jgi:hypothetical protein
MFSVRDSSSGATESGGATSEVTTNVPAASFSSSVDTGWCGGAGCGRSSPCHHQGWRTSRNTSFQNAARAVRSAKKLRNAAP